MNWLKDKASKMIKWLEENFLKIWAWIAAVLLLVLACELLAMVESLRLENNKALLGVLAGMMLFPKLRALLDKLLSKLKK